MITFCPLASGSKGNALYLGSEKAKVLVDAGISARMARERLATIGVALSDIEAILVTHEHTDHIRGLGVLGAKMGIPVFANSDTARAIYDLLGGGISFKVFSTGEHFTYKDLIVDPFSIQHDTVDPVGFTISVGRIKVGICTDLGFATSLVRQKLQKCDYLVVEANHHPPMVHACPRPMSYKQRVLSNQGHLSNESCAELLIDVIHDKLKHVHLAHLSEECNSPDLALKMCSEKLLECEHKPKLSIAHQNKMSELISFSIK